MSRGLGDVYKRQRGLGDVYKRQGPILTCFWESWSESDPGTCSFPDSLKKKDFLLLLPNSFLFFGEKDDASRELSELLSIPMATRALENEQK